MFIRFTGAVVIVFFSSILILPAQQTKSVQFLFSAGRVNDSLGYLSVKASVAKGSYLFSVKKQGADDAFISSVKFDSGTSKYTNASDTAIEIGQLQSVKDTNASALFRYFADSVEFRFPLHITSQSDTKIKGSFAWLAKSGDEYPSGEESFSVTVKSIQPTTTIASSASTAAGDKSLSGTFLLCLAAGFLAVITPCVFPLIPVTVSFFLKRSKTRKEGVRNAILYSLSIILIYTIPTLLITLVFGDKALYTISTHPVSNLLFFTIFIVFAISFFGAFELSLPNSWANKADEKAGKGGLTGIFFMALTLVIVSFSCTGPIVGTLLGQTSTRGISLAPILGMFGFSLGLALPFSLFALFPSLLQSLPKSGGWLNSVKVCFGFVELALALKFLSNVDLIYHWRLLDREVFLVLWIVIAFLLGLYLLGKLKFSHDSDLSYVSIPRLFFAIATFSFALYLVPGLWGAPLKSLSGLLPPATTLDFNLNELQYKIGTASSSSNTSSSSKSAAKPPALYTDKLHVPFGLTAYFDLEEGMAAAKALNKPVMLDFTGHSCANCRKMEGEVWSNPEVLKRMKEDFVLISLYVDEPSELPDAAQYTNSRKEKISTLGEKNLDYEITKFGFNAQPLYMFLDLQGNTLSDVKYGYDSNIRKFIDHLDTVKKEFAKRK